MHPREEVVIDYTNWRGERAKRRIYPLRIVYENNEYHPETQWLLEAFDFDKGAERTFALASIHSWQPARADSDGECDWPESGSPIALRARSVRKAPP